MNKLIEIISALASRGTAIVGIEYEGSDAPVKNLILGSAYMANPPFGKAITSALFENKGAFYLRGLDHNDHNQPKVFALDKIKSLTVDGRTVKAFGDTGFIDAPTHLANR